MSNFHSSLKAYKALSGDPRTTRETVTGCIAVPDPLAIYADGPEYALNFLTIPDEHITRDAFYIKPRHTSFGECGAFGVEIHTLFGGEYMLHHTTGFSTPWEETGTGKPHPDTTPFVYSPEVNDTHLLPREARDTEKLSQIVEEGGVIRVCNTSAFNEWLNHLDTETANIIRNSPAQRGSDNDPITITVPPREVGVNTYNALTSQ